MGQRLASVMLWLLLGIAGADGAEVIERFDAEIAIAADATVVVTERIAVVAEGSRIRRGIFRDIPLVYRDRGTHTYRVGFEILSVRRNGADEPWSMESLDNGVRIRIGSAERFLPHGPHTYEIRYRTWRQLGFFDAHDELYWNVTGTGWDFPIREATARVTVPAAVSGDAVRMSAWTGAQGSTEQAATWRLEGSDTAVFESTRRLARRQGLTIAFAFPKGVVEEPSTLRYLGWFVADNPHVPLGVVVLLALLGYYGYWWREVGRDPERGVIVPRYEPPEGWSPAALRYLRRGGHDQVGFVAAIVNLAVLGSLRIEEEDGDYTLRSLAGPRTGSRGERRIMGRLFKAGNHLALENTNHEQVRAAMFDQKLALVHELEEHYLLRNRNRWLPGVIGSAISLLVLCIVAGGFQGLAVIYILIPTLVIPLGVASLIFYMSRTPGPAGRAVHFSVGLMLLFIASPGLTALFHLLGLLGSLIVLAIVILNIAFFHWLQAPMREGQRVLDEIEGLRLYMEVAEKDDLVRQQEPPRTLERFEKLLPFAIALEVAETWADHFGDVLARAMVDGSLPARNWATSSIARGDFAGNLGSAVSGSITGALVSGLGDSIASSSIAPGSSSGFAGGGSSSSGGGGFSGGGGGGGGGGGW